MMRIPKATKVVCQQGADRWIRQEMRRRGLQVIGSGAYAVVFSSGKTARRVVKTIKVSDNEAYVDYLKKIVLPLQGKSTLVPKVYNIEHFEVEYESWRGNDRERVMLITMERLRSYRSLKRNQRKHATQQDVGMVSVWDIEDLAYGYRCEVDEVLWDQCAPKLKQVLKKIWKIGRRHSIDLHDGNVMWRKVYSHRPELVITDPVA